MQKIVSLVLGTGAGAAMVCGTAVGLGQLRFRRQVDAEVAALLHQERKASRSIVCADDLAGLPQPIRRWLEHACSRARVEPGVLLRYLTETVWFPAALLSPLVTWQPIDNTTAQATLEYWGTRASATFTIDGNGAVLRADAERYRAEHGKYVLRHWSIPITEYGEFAGTRMPVAGEATWCLDGGDMPYYRWRITSVTYDEQRLSIAPRPTRVTVMAQVVGA